MHHCWPQTPSSMTSALPPYAYDNKPMVWLSLNPIQVHTRQIQHLEVLVFYRVLLLATFVCAHCCLMPAATCSSCLRDGRLIPRWSQCERSTRNVGWGPKIRACCAGPDGANGHIWIGCNVRWEVGMGQFFLFWSFFKKIEKWTCQNIFSRFGPFESCQSGWRDSWIGHIV
jgi:hypothetical protein